jgi:hypothetical protein
MFIVLSVESDVIIGIVQLLLSELGSDTEDGGNTFLRNFSELLSDYTASHPRK